MFDTSYDAGGYPRRVRYATATPTPPLRPEQAAWVRQRLHEKGLLPPETAG